MPDEPIFRSEFEGYIRRHEKDEYAHAPMRHDFRNEMLGQVMSNERRLTALERWQQRIVGALILFSFITGGGAVAVVVELLRK